MKKILSVALSVIIASGCFLYGNPVKKNSEVFAESKSADDEYIPVQTVYDKLISMKQEYPQGTAWTNENMYSWKGGIYSGGVGCAAFAFLLSDSAFGNLPARKHTDSSRVKTGDVLRLYNDSHSVIVLEKEGSIVTVAEGNLNSTVYWGRKIDLSDKSSGFTYVLTRYPKKGDINSSNDINAQDAGLILEEYSALSVSAQSGFDDRQKWASDIDGDGKTDAGDASVVLEFYAYLSTSNDDSQIDIREWLDNNK